MILGSRQVLSKILHMPHADIKINNIPIKRLYECRNLGVTFDEVLSWRRHVSRSIQRAMGNYITISRFKKFMSRESKIILVEYVVLSQFNFGDTLLLNISQELHRKIQRVQNLCLRFIFDVKKNSDVSYDVLLSRLNTLDMYHRRVLHSLCRVRDTRTFNRNIYFPNSRVSSIHNKSFKFFAARIWN